MSTVASPGRITGHGGPAVGQHFTPASVAAFLWDLLCFHRGPASARARVVDPAAGEGALLQPVLEAQLEDGALAGACVGIEVDASVARRGHPWGVRVGDGLFELAAGAFDVVVVNPPFGRASAVLTARQWARLAAGEGPFEIWGNRTAGPMRRWAARPVEQLFVQRALWLARPGGLVGLILPDGLLANHRAQAARDWILERARPLSIVALPTAAFQGRRLRAQAHIVVLRAAGGRDAGCTQEFCRIVPRRRTTRRELAQTLDQIGADLRAAATGASPPGVLRLRPDQLVSQRWDAGFWHGRRHRPMWRSSLAAVPLGSFVEHLTYGPIVTGGGATHDPSGVVSIRQGDFDDTGLRLEEALRVPRSGVHDPPRSRVRAGDLLLPRSGAGALGRNRVAVYLETEEANVGCFVDRIRLHGINPFYVWLFLRSRPGWAQIQAAINGVGTPNINFAEIRSLQIPALDEEQQAAVEQIYRERVLPVHLQGGQDAGSRLEAQRRFLELVQQLEAWLAVPPAATG